ncbi:hypothetical protein GCM10025880_37890 [Methylorubrum aminovorans]|nr:hypothetical protein GCM10025880_37890 [Methylorubrum aminovorans]
MAADKVIAGGLPPSSFETLLVRVRAARATPAASALGVFAVRIGAAGFAYGAQVLMARMMGGAEYGIFATVWVWIAILGHTATFGLSQGACRFLPADQATDRLDSVRGFLLGGALASLGGGLVLSLGGLAVALLQGACSRASTARRSSSRLWSCRSSPSRTISRAWPAARAGHCSPSRRPTCCAKP